MAKSVARWAQQIWFPVSLGVILRLIQLQAPILGIHSWRQADTAAMARHFAMEGTPIWLPQIDWGGASAGYVECEFPLYPYLLGHLYKLAGLHEWLGRGLSVFCSALAIVFIIRIGRRLLDPISAWWGGVFFAVLPLGVYYGRTLQAEALLLLLAAISIERLLVWKEKHSRWALLTSWLAFCLACLIKVLPLIWLGIPLLVVQMQPQPLGPALPLATCIRGLGKLLRSPGPWIYASSSILIGALWYAHAYQLGQSSGFTFGFWGNNSDRSSLNLLLDVNLWLDIFLRISKHLAFLGVPIVIVGLWESRRDAGGQILAAGLLSMAACTAVFLRASFIHEYYQLPLLIFLCPLMGKGWQSLTKLIASKGLHHPWLININLALIIAISLVVLNFDYWAIERKQAEIWMPLAQSIRKEVPSKARIVSVTGSDPSLLNLARRQGWRTTAKGINQKKLQAWAEQGATHLAGSLNWETSFKPLTKGNARHQLHELLCEQSNSKVCPQTSHQTYLAPINQLIR